MGQDIDSEIESSCTALLNELQLIWDEVGETEDERDKMLMEIEQECLDVYRRKVDQANRSRARMHQMIADIHSEIVSLASSLGDRPPVTQLEKRGNSLREQLTLLKPILEEMTHKREERIRAFRETQSQIQKLQQELSPLSDALDSLTIADEDLTHRKFEELQLQLQALQKEKNDRLFKVAEYVDEIHEICAVLSYDFFETIRTVHPTLDESSPCQTKSISTETISKLDSMIISLKEEKLQRMQQIQDLGASLLQLWNLMDTPVEEQHQFQHVTCNVAAAEHEIVTEGALSLRVIQEAIEEVKRLEDLKASKMKELVLKKRTELEEICRKSHIIPDTCATLDKAISSMESGMVDPAELLASIEDVIGNVKEEAFSRKDIMDRIEKWMSACEDESWLEEYNKDDNRYSATRGAHLNLKRAEKARIAVGKIPALLDALVMKTTAWEEERGKPFLYDGVRLLSTIEEYNILRMEKEEEKRRQRDQKRLHEQLVNEQETLFGTKPSPNGRTPSKKALLNSRMNGGSTPSNRRLSLGGAMLQHDSMASSRLNAVTPVRNAPSHTPVSTINKDNRIKTPVSVNRALILDDSVLPTGNTNMNQAANTHAFFGNETDIQRSPVPGARPTAAQEIDGQGNVPRLPLSPVAPTALRSNTAAETITSTPVTKTAVTIMKSPLSVTPRVVKPAATIVDEENMTPRQPSLPPESSSAPSNVQQTVQQAASQSQSHQSHEYSFEERRLYYMLHHGSSTTWTDCR